jgi:hypothetical protein
MPFVCSSHQQSHSAQPSHGHYQNLQYSHRLSMSGVLHQRQQHSYLLWHCSDVKNSKAITHAHLYPAHYVWLHSLACNRTILTIIRIIDNMLQRKLRLRNKHSRWRTRLLRSKLHGLVHNSKTMHRQHCNLSILYRRRMFQQSRNCQVHRSRCTRMLQMVDRL